MDFRGDCRVGEIVGILIVPPAKIKPRVRKLVRKYRCVRANIANPIELKYRPRPRVPAFRRQRIVVPPIPSRYSIINSA